MSYDHLGRVQLASGDLGAAQKAYETALRIAHQNFADSPNPITAEAFYGLGETAFAQSRFTAANSALTQSLKMRQSLFPANHPDLLATAEALKKLKKAQAAAL